MASTSDLYRRLCRLRAKLRRIQRQVTNLERRLAGKKEWWGNCTRQRKR